MARYTLTNAFTTLTGLSEGTLQNVSRNVPIEISSSTNKNAGVILNPGDKLQFTADSTIYARAAWENPSPTETVYLAYEPFKPKGERGDIYQFRGSVATYSDLPASPNVGDVYDIQTADAEHGILAGDNVAWNGTSWDKLAGIYQVMTGATPSTAGAAGLVPAPAAG